MKSNNQATVSVRRRIQAGNDTIPQFAESGLCAKGGLSQRRQSNAERLGVWSGPVVRYRSYRCPGSSHEGGGLGYSVLSNVRMRHNDILVLICFIRFLSHLLLPYSTWPFTWPENCWMSTPMTRLVREGYPLSASLPSHSTPA